MAEPSNALDAFAGSAETTPPPPPDQPDPAVEAVVPNPIHQRSERDEFNVQQNEGSFLNRTYDAFGGDNLFLNIPDYYREAERRISIPDPSFKPGKETLTGIADEFGIDEANRPALFEALSWATNERDLREIALRSQEDFDRMARMSRAGVLEQFGYTGLAVVADPLLIVSGAGGAAMGVGKLLTRGGRLSRTLKGGLAGSTTSAVQEGLLALQDTSRNEKDVLVAAAAGLVLGGGFGAASSLFAKAGGDPHSVVDSARLMDDVDNTVVARTGVTTRESDIFEPVDDADLSGTPDIGTVETRTTREPLEEVLETDSVGAARTDDGVVIEDLVELDDPTKSILARAIETVEGEDAGQLTGLSTAGKARIDLMRAFHDSKRPELRALGALLAPSHTGYADTAARQMPTAWERRNILEAESFANTRQAMHGGFISWAEEQGVPWWKRTFYMAAKESEQFSESVFNHVVLNTAEANPHILKAASALRSDMARVRDTSVAAGVLDPGVPRDPNYMPRIPSAKNFQQSLGMHGNKPITQWMHLAMATKQPWLDDRAARTIAKAWYEKVAKTVHGLDVGMMNGLPLDDLSKLRTLMEEAGVKSGDIQYVIDNMKNAVKEGRIPRAKRRIDIDPTVTLRTKNGVISYGSLYETDASELVRAYSRRMAGAIALKERLGIVGSAGDEVKLSNEIRAMFIGEDVTQAHVNSVVTKALMMVRQIAGKPMDPGQLDAGTAKPHVRVSRAARNAAFITFMPQGALASIPEFGLIAAKDVFGVLFHAIPGFRGFIRNARTGGFDDEGLSALEWFAGVGADDLIHPQFSRYADFTYDVLDEAGTSKVEQVLSQGARIVAERISGLAPLTRIQRRMAAYAIINEMHRWGRNGVDAAKSTRLAQMGLSESDLKKIVRLMDENQISIEQFKSKNLTRPNLEAIQRANPALFERWRTAVHREAYRTVIEAAVGDAPAWLVGPLGSVLGQFMSFTINSYPKLLLRAAVLGRQGDAQVWMSTALSMGFASMAYTTQQYLNTIGRPEQRKKRLSTDAIMKAAFARSGVASFMPNLVDAVGRMAFDKAVFDSRSTGLPSGAVGGIPVIALMDNIVGALGGAASSVTNDNRQFNRESARDAMSLLPLLNMVGVRALSEYLAAQLPVNSIIDQSLEPRE